VRAGVTCDEIDRVVHEVDGLFCLLGCWFVLFVGLLGCWAVGLLVCWTPSTMSARSQPPTPLRPPFDHPEPSISWGRGEATSSRRLITPRGNEERDVRDASRARLSVAGTPRIPFKDASDAAFPSPARRGSPFEHASDAASLSSLWRSRRRWRSPVSFVRARTLRLTTAPPCATSQTHTHAVTAGQRRARRVPVAAQLLQVPALGLHVG
jgi:hypothetical protein